MWQNRKQKLSLYFNLDFGGQACQGVGINEGPGCWPECSGGTFYSPGKVRNTGEFMLSLLSAFSGNSGASCWDFTSTSPLITSFLPSLDKLRNNLLHLTRWGWPSIQLRSGSSMRNPKTVGLVSAPTCRQSTMLGSPIHYKPSPNPSSPRWSSCWSALVSLSPHFSPLVPSPSAGAWHFG